MRVLIINKFLYPNGGSETYIFKLGEALEQHGHEVQYFGMEHEGRCVGNRINAYTSDMDFHGGSKLSKLTYPIKTIYSKEAREKLRLRSLKRKITSSTSAASLRRRESTLLLRPAICYQILSLFLLVLVRWKTRLTS